jgi:hypothetical protein
MADRRETTRGTEVTCRDLASGETETQVILDDFVVVTDGNCEMTHVASYPSTGTVVITIKRAKR